MEVPWNALDPERLVKVGIQKKLRSSVLFQLFFTRGSCLNLMETVPRLQLGPKAAKKEKRQKSHWWQGYLVGEAARRKKRERDGGQTETGSV